MKHVLTASRLHLIAFGYTIAWPWLILASSLAINLVIQALLDPASRAQGFSGGIASIYVVVAVWAYQTIAQIFPFALGAGVTRRAFAAGTGLVLVLGSLAFAAVLTVLRYLEGASDGFGVQLHFFRVPGLVQDNAAAQLVVYAVPFVLLGAVMMGVGVVHHRWRQHGVFALSVAVGLLLGAVAALLTWRDAWGAFFDWFADSSTLVTMVALPLLVAALAAAAGYRALLRATP
ncbi:ABC transporter permease [Angustibacter sp. McL0619]|uniref:ABC transporter permease n=1 Tax=Angustibacter sp. McL0619 TaxID=3415676 RepID=UPI003CEBE8CA